ncbi:MAG: hypothetical protein ABJD11_13405, partial [Gemmatimonadota bacterium]
MLIASLIAAGLVFGPPSHSTDPVVKVQVDSAHHQIIVTAGPYHVPNMPPMDHSKMDMMEGHETAVQHFNWPVQGWLRGFDVTVTDAEGHPLANKILHHLIVINFDRRQLMYRAAERLGGAGSETGEVSVPKTIGVPMTPGTNMGMYAAWHNEGKDVDGAYMRLVLLWTPSNQNPQPVTAMPLYMDVNLTVGGTNTFDVPPGKSTKSHEFVFPISGHILGVGGHLHDYGAGLRFEDAESGKVLITLGAQRDSAGHILKIDRKLFGVSGQGLKIKAGHRYRVVGLYDNPTGKMIPDGAMAHMSGLFVPDDLSKWPSI